MNGFLNRKTLFPSYMFFPKFLLEERRISETAKILYCVLLDRARLSLKSEKWIEESGNAFVSFSLKELATVIGKSEMTVKSSLRALEGIDLIARKRRGGGLTNRIYVKIPPFTERQNVIPLTERKPSPPYISNNKDKDYKRIYECKEDESL
ncbi:MAG: replication initiator protein A [Oscillospiraceae bacterium]|nr:replication initiator protein A [Oscillospiraceae bacterium]